MKLPVKKNRNNAIGENCMWKEDPILKKAMSSGPRMFALLALAFIDRWGEEAKELIYRTIYMDGIRQGKALAAKAKDTSDLLEFERLAIETMNDLGFNSPGFDDPARQWLIKEKKRIQYNLSQCNGCEVAKVQVWKEMGLDDKTIEMLGQLSCIPSDLGRRKGFNPKIMMKFTKLETDGDPYCEWYEEIKD